MKISAREKLFLSLLAIVLLAYVFYTYYYVEKMEALATLRSEANQLIARKQMMEQKIKDGKTLEQEYVKTKSNIILLSNKFFSDKDQEEFIMLINDLSDESKVAVEQIQFKLLDGKEAVTKFEAGQNRVDRFAMLIQQNKIKGYVKPGSDNLAPITEDIAPPIDKDSVTANAETNQKKSSVEGSHVSYADEQTAPADSGEDGEKKQVKKGQTPDSIKDSENPLDITYTHNIKSLIAIVEVDGDYEEIHQLVSLIAMSDQNIIVEKIEIAREEVKGKLITKGKLTLNFYKVVELDEYFAEKESVLATKLVAKTNKSTPFTAHLWSFKMVPASGGTVATNGFGNAIALPKPETSVISPYTSDPTFNLNAQYPQNTGLVPYPYPGVQSNVQQPRPPQENVQPDFSQLSEYERLNFGGYVKRESASTPSSTPLPEAQSVKVISFESTQGLNLELDSNGNSNRGQIILSDDSGLKMKTTKVEYHLGEVGYYGAIRLNLLNKNIVLNQKANDLLLKVKSTMQSGHNLGIEIVDANNMVHNIVMYEDIDWTDWKDVRVLNLPRMAYPAKIKSIYVSRVEDSKITDSAIYLESLSFNYK